MKKPFSETSKSMITVFVALALFVVSLSIEFVSCSPEVNTDIHFARPTTALYNDQIFTSQGSITRSLPDGARYLGQTNYSQDVRSLDEDLDCNRKGSLYADPENRKILYFESDSWDETVDGPMKYNILVLVEE